MDLDTKKTRETHNLYNDKQNVLFVQFDVSEFAIR